MDPHSFADPAHTAASVRDAGLPEFGRPVPRPMIAASWQRSSACGVSADKRSELPYDQNFDNDSRLLRAARPVLERLVTTLADTPTSVLLADRHARIVQRWAGEKSLFNALDRADAAPGFGFAEEFAGTNGVGTVLEESAVVAVRGEEHYADFLRHLSCVGVPIHHPVTRAIEGILDLTCLASDYNPFMPPLLIEAVRHIETRLTQMSSPSEVALLEEFIRACRSHRGAVVGVSPTMILTNPAAVEHLTPLDQAVLWDVASQLIGAGRSERTVDLERGRFRMRCVPVSVDSRQPSGFVLRLDFGQVWHSRQRAVPRPDPATLAPSLPGRTPQWRQVMSRVRDIAEVRQPVAITGEPGTGKFRLAKHLHEMSRRVNPDSQLRVFDAGTVGEVTPTELIERVAAALALDSTVILRHIDALPPPALAQLASLTSQNPVLVAGHPAGRLIVTARVSADGAPELERALATFRHQVWVPPLHQHAEDIVDLVPALLGELSGQRITRCSLPAVQALLRCPWPGNVAELRDALAAAALAAVAGGEIQPAHLPVWVLKRANQRGLSALERSERNIIIDTLASVGDNRTEAAKILGIGRATLYRKMRSFGIASRQELAR